MERRFTEAESALINEYYPLALKLARGKVYSAGNLLTEDELLAAAEDGLMKAATTYDPAKAYNAERQQTAQFKTYAYRVISDYLNKAEKRAWRQSQHSFLLKEAEQETWIADPACAVETAAADTVLSKEIDALLSALPLADEEFAIIKALYDDGYSKKATAELLSVPLAKVNRACKHYCELLLAA